VPTPPAPGWADFTLKMDCMYSRKWSLPLCVYSAYRTLLYISSVFTPPFSTRCTFSSNACTVNPSVCIRGMRKSAYHELSEALQGFAGTFFETVNIVPPEPAE
jgi:hypothetical protein